jgi:hypothetical protein
MTRSRRGTDQRIDGNRRIERPLRRDLLKRVRHLWSELDERLFEQASVGVVYHQAGPKQREGGGPDAPEVVVEPMAAFQSRSARVRREVSRSEVRSWVANSSALTITEGGIEGRPLPSAYRGAKSSSETISWPCWASRS